jgi:LemA protein
MQTEIMILLAVTIVIALWVVAIYNKFVTTKTHIEASIQEIGNQLKRQAELIPNLVSSVKGYMKHETAAIKAITEARKQVLEVIGKGGAANAQQLLDMGAKLNQALTPIRAVFESTPELQAAGPTQNLMNELRDTSDKVMYSRRTLIDLTADFNVMIIRFPSNLVASLFKFTKQPGLHMPEGAATEATTVNKGEIKTPKVEL